MPKTIEQIVNILFDQVKPYNTHCRSIMDKRDVFDKIDLRLHNERTIAHFFDVEIQRELERLSKPCRIISECSMKYLIAQKEKDHANSAITIEPNKDLREYMNDEHKLYIPDTAIIEHIKEPHVYFIEYKVDDRYSIYKLALDYLKYKYYSSGLGCNSSFIYVLFYKLSDGTIELHGSIKLEKTLELTDQYLSKSIFVDSQDAKMEFRVSDETILLVEEADEVIRNAGHIRSFKSASDNETDSISSLEDNVFYRNMGILKSNVVTAEIIRKNYPTLAKLANNITSKLNVAEYDVDGLYNLTPDNFESMAFTDEDCIKLRQYFNNQINRILKEEMQDLPAMYNFSKKRATWILILLQRLAINNGWGDMAREFKIGISNNKIQGYQRLIEEKYSKNMKRLNQLCLGLLYFIRNLYKVIFDITENNEVTDYNDTYKNIENTNKNNSIARKIAKTLDIKISRDFNIASAPSQEEFLQKVVAKLSS